MRYRVFRKRNLNLSKIDAQLMKYIHVPLSRNDKAPEHNEHDTAIF